MAESGGGPKWATILGLLVGVPGAIVALTTLIVMIANASGGNSPSHKHHHHPRGLKSGIEVVEPEEESVPELSRQQLLALLVPEDSYQRMLPQRYYALSEDNQGIALQGGISKLKLCDTAISVDHMGLEFHQAYDAGDELPGPMIYFGSDVASFKTRQSAERLLQTAKEEGERCEWRALDAPPGKRAPLGEQVVRLAAERQSSEEGEDMLYVDVILLRDRGVVLEIASETVSGLHSADAEALAESAAARLARAVHSG